MALGEPQTGNAWIEAVLQALCKAEWAQITNIEWHECADGIQQLVVLTPQGPLSEEFSRADLEKLPADSEVRSAVELKLATLIAGGYANVDIGAHPDPLDVQCAAQTDAPVLISGVTATGRESLARGIHTGSRHSQQAFKTVDCGSTCAQALKAALAEQPGTTYLDDIDALGSDLQALVSRLLENRGDNRIIAGTGVDLATEAQRETFAVGLFYRLNVVHLVIDQGVPETGESQPQRSDGL